MFRSALRTALTVFIVVIAVSAAFGVLSVGKDAIVAMWNKIM